MIVLLCCWCLTLSGSALLATGIAPGTGTLLLLPSMILLVRQRATAARGLRRTALLVTSLMLTLGLAEMSLRLTGAVYLWLHPRTAPGAGGRAVLCIGDSNTFGIWMDTAGTYPTQLGALLEARAPGTFRVVNLGVPGLNTWSMVSHLEADLTQHRPVAVVLMGGYNDRWGSPPRTLRADTPFERLRLVRLARLFVDRGEPPASQPAPDDPKVVSAVMRDGTTRPFVVEGKPLHDDKPALRASVMASMQAAVAIARENGVLPILSTYGSDHTGMTAINDGTRAAAAATGAALIDPAMVFRAGGPDIDRARLLLSDGHPDREGYGVIARLLFNALVDAGVVAGPRVADPFEALRGRHRPAPRVTLSTDANGDPVLDVTFLPDFDCKVLLSGGSTQGTTAWGFAIPLDKDAVFDATCRRDELLAAFDATGRARVAIPKVVRDLLGGRPVKAMAVAVRFAAIAGHDRIELARFPEVGFTTAYVAGASDAVDITPGR